MSVSESKQYTRQMKAVSERFNGQLISDLIVEGINSGLTLTELAARLEVKVVTLHYWLLALDIRVERVALRRSERVRIVAESEGEKGQGY